MACSLETLSYDPTVSSIETLPLKNVFSVKEDKHSTDSQRKFINKIFSEPIMHNPFFLRPSGPYITTQHDKVSNILTQDVFAKLAFSKDLKFLRVPQILSSLVERASRNRDPFDPWEAYLSTALARHASIMKVFDRNDNYKAVNRDETPASVPESHQSLYTRFEAVFSDALYYWNPQIDDEFHGLDSQMILDITNLDLTLTCSHFIHHPTLLQGCLVANHSLYESLMEEARDIRRAIHKVLQHLNPLIASGSGSVRIEAREARLNAFKSVTSWYKDKVLERLEREWIDTSCLLDKDRNIDFDSSDIVYPPTFSRSIFNTVVVAEETREHMRECFAKSLKRFEQRIRSSSIAAGYREPFDDIGNLEVDGSNVNVEGAATTLAVEMAAAAMAMERRMRGNVNDWESDDDEDEDKENLPPG